MAIKEQPVATLQYKLTDFGESTGAAARMCSVKKLFLKIELKTATLLTNRLCHRCFPMNFAKFLRTPFLIEHQWWLLLNQGHWFLKQELLEWDEPNICNMVRYYLWHQSNFLQNIPLNKQSKKIYRITVFFDSCFSFYILSPWLY